MHPDCGEAGTWEVVRVSECSASVRPLPFRSFDYEVYEPKGDVVGVGGFNSLEVE